MNQNPTQSEPPAKANSRAADGPLQEPCSGRIGAEIGTDANWPDNLMCRLVLPVPVKELAAIGKALAKIAKQQGKEARMKQVGTVLEIFTVPNDEDQATRRDSRR